MQEEIKQPTNLVHNSMTKLIRRGRSWLIQDTLDKLNLDLQIRLISSIKFSWASANALTSTIFCNIEKIQMN